MSHNLVFTIFDKSDINCLTFLDILDVKFLSYIQCPFFSFFDPIVFVFTVFLRILVNVPQLSLLAQRG